MTGIETALAWHRVCGTCGIRMQVSIADPDTDEPIPSPKPSVPESPCLGCDMPSWGEWISGPAPAEPDFSDEDDG